MNRSLLALLAAATLTVGACSSSGSDADSTTTEAESPTTSTTEAAQPVDDQTPPQSINGITVDGDTVWAATISGDEVLQIRIADGAIVGRWATEGAGPDDVALASDGSVWVTGFSNGDVGRVADGSYSRVTGDIATVNPLEFDTDGTLYLGTFGPDGSLYSLETDGGAPVDGTSPTPIDEGTMPDINGFAGLADGTIFSPAGGLAGPGSAILIDPETGDVTTVVGDLAPVAAGTLYLSSFIAPTLTEVQPDGTVRVIDVGA